MSIPARTAGRGAVPRAAAQSAMQESLAGTGRVTLARTGGGAGPDWGAYILLYTTQPQPDGGRAAIIAPDHPDLNPAWGLHQPANLHADPGTATRPLWDYAAAANTPQGREPSPRYELRLALYLLDSALGPRLVPHPTAIDLPEAGWEIVPYRPIPLPPGAAHAGHTAVRIGRLVTLTPKETA